MKPKPKTERLKASGVYVLQQGTKFYVGKSADVAKRIKEHKHGTTCCRFTSRSKRVRPLTQPVTAGDDEVRTVNLNTTKHVHILKQRAL